MTEQSGTFIEEIIERERREPDRTAIIFMADDGSEEIVTARQLYNDVVACALVLQENGVEPQDVVIIALPHSRNLVSAFWGALFLGAIPSIFPYSIPMPRAAVYNEHIRTMVLHSGARAVVTASALEAELALRLSDLSCQVITISKVPGQGSRTPRSLSWQYAAGEQISYLQYTSGTTGLQKGVLLSHRAIANFIQALEIGPRDVVVNWLPLHHDFGLFIGLVAPIAIGIPTVLMSPFKFIRNPKALFWAIHKYKGTMCWIPNFAYNHSVRNIREHHLAGIDLGHLRVFGCGGEPIHYNSQQMFLERFAPYGFKEEAFITGYGMAENTLTATISLLGERAPVDWIDVQELQNARRAVPRQARLPGSLPMVSCGVPVRGAEVAIVDDDGDQLTERRIGEVIIRTDTLFTGYHRRPDLTAQKLKDGWFYTGDMGYLAEGHLYICGRKDDLIIVGGNNIHPEDLEAIAESVPGIFPGRAVAFGVTDERLGSEKIVMVCDLERSVIDGQKQQIESELHHRVTQELGVTLGEVHLVKKGWVIKTRNGKMSRTANRRKYETHIGGNHAQVNLPN